MNDNLTPLVSLNCFKAQNYYIVSAMNLTQIMTTVTQSSNFMILGQRVYLTSGRDRALMRFYISFPLSNPQL